MNALSSCVVPDLHATRALLLRNPVDGVLSFIRTGFIPPYALRRILAALALSATQPEAKKTAYLWASVFFLANLTFAQVDVFQRWYTRRCYERTRGQLFCALHYKALRRVEGGGKAVGMDGKEKSKDGEDGKKARKRNKKEAEKENGADLGKIVNLMQ